MGLIAPRYRGLDGKPTTHLNEEDAHDRSQKASVFFDQRVFFWKGQFYTRADIIKMHANALGGVHFDFRKAQAETHILEIKDYFGFEIKGSNNQMLVGPEISAARADPARRQQVYDATELVAMDTVRIFARGIRESAATFTSLLVPHAGSGDSMAG